MTYYSIDNDARKPIYYYASFTALGCSQLVRLIPVESSLSFIAPSAMVLFGLIMKLYDTCLWKYGIFQYVSKIPVLEGKWSGKLTRSSPDGTSIETTRDVNLTITQTWSRIAVTFQGERSSSEAKIVGIHCEDHQNVRIQWVYHAQDESGIAHVNLYGEGTTRLTLHTEDGEMRLKGNYYSSKLRKGGIELKLQKRTK